MRRLLIGLVSVAAALPIACSSDSDGGGGAGGSSGSAGSGGVSGSAGSGGVGGSGGVQPTLEAELYDRQPMVVDVSAALPDGIAASLELAADLGVKIATLPEDDPDSRRFRLRGLAPDTEYQAELVVADQRFPVSFRTRPPLKGFKAKFPVTVAGTPAQDYRIFDYASAPEVDNAGIYALDAAGTPRWYFAIPEAAVIDDLAAGVKLLPDGNILFTQGERVRVVDELGDTVVEVTAKQLGVPLLHHDVIPLPGGKFMAISLELRDVYYPADSATHYVAGDFLVEFNEAGVISWSWSALDHLDPQRKREGFDNPYYPYFSPSGSQAKDWTHSNGVVYLPGDDSLLLSMRHQDWVVKIDHKTGNVIWKLGDEGDFSLTSGSWFFHQHSPEVQADGTILLYDNGVSEPGLNPSLWRTRPMRLALDTSAMTASVVWEETNESYLAMIAGDVDRMSNGHLLVLDTAISASLDAPFPSYPRIREVDPATNAWVWTFDGPDGDFIYRCTPSRRLPGEAE